MVQHGKQTVKQKITDSELKKKFGKFKWEVKQLMNISSGIKGSLAFDKKQKELLLVPINKYIEYIYSFILRGRIPLMIEVKRMELQEILKKALSDTSLIDSPWFLKK